MKKWLVLILLVLLVGCSVDDGELLDKSDLDVLDKPQKVKVTGDVSLELSNVYKLNELSDDLNLLKMYTTCYDSSTDTVYATGIMTDTVGYYEGDSLGYIETGLGVGSFELKDLECGDGYLTVSTDKHVKVYYENELVDSLDFKVTIFNQGVTILNDFFVVPVTDDDVFHFYNLEDLKKVGIVEKSVGNWYYIDGEYVFFETKDGNIISYYDDSFDFLREEELTFSCNLLDVVYDGSEFWYLCKEGVYVGGQEITDVVPDADQIYYANGYVSVVTSNGFDDGTVGSYLGGVTVVDAITKESLYEYELDHHHKRCHSDGDYLVLTNNDDNSVIKMELESGDYEVLQFGNSAEHGVVLDDGSVIVSNRLGGSTLFHIKNGVMNEIDVGEWPVGLAYDSALNRIFSFDFLAGRISVIDGVSDEIVDEYYIGYECETDAIGDLAYDSLQNILYAVVPERNQVVAVDALTGDVLSLIDLEDYGVDYMDMGGAAALTADVHEESSMLYVFIQKVKKLYLYDSDFSLVKSIQVECENDIKDFPYSLFVDDYNDKVYVCGAVYSLEGDSLGSVPTSYSVVAADEDDGLLFTVDLGDNELENLIVMDSSYNELAEIGMAENQYVKARFAYDSVNNKMFVFYMVLGEVWEYNVLIE
jgi:DNA-binding beta-propeller fold protein YncE